MPNPATDRPKTPSPVQKLSTAQREKAVTWLNEKIPDIKCPLCGNPEWSVAPFFAEIPIATRTHVREGSFFRVILASCSTCHVMFHFNPVEMGLDDAEDGDTATEAAAQPAVAGV